MLDGWLQVWLDAWPSWLAIAVSAWVYGLMTLTLRVSEPTGLTARLGLAQGRSSGTDGIDDAVSYLSTRMVLTSFRTASVIAIVVAAERGAQHVVGDSLSLVAVSLIGVGILIGLIVMRAVLNRLADACYDDVAIWLAPISWLARQFGRILPLRRLASYANDEQPNSESMSEPADDLINVLHNLAANDVRASDLMLPLAEVVAVNERVCVGALGDMMIRLDLDTVVVYGRSVDDVRGTVSKSDVLQALREGIDDNASSEGILTQVFALTTTQQVANVVKSFRGRTEYTAVVVAEDSKLEGILTYERLMRKLLSNGDGGDEEAAQDQE